MIIRKATKKHFFLIIFFKLQKLLIIFKINIFFNLKKNKKNARISALPVQFPMQTAALAVATE